MTKSTGESVRARSGADEREVPPCGAAAPAPRSGSAPSVASFEREIGVCDAGRDGPLFFVTGGIHGNEPAGVHAARKVFAALRERELPVRGRVVFLAGNLAGLQARVRYHERDLNRLWGRATIARAQGTPAAVRCTEEREMLALLARIEQEIDAHRGRGEEIACLDLHTSSADGPPFSCMGDTLRNRRVAFALPVPVILGLEETLDGAMLDMFYERGAIAVAVEGGLHDDPAAIARLEDAIWIALVAGGVLARDAVPELPEREARLRAAAAGLPPVLEVRHREALVDTDEFRMRAGLRSFDPVVAGDELAEKNGRTLTAAEDGYVLLPLYQGKGSDGYFLGRAVQPFWLWLSAVLRRIGFWRILPLLPGVAAHPEQDDAFVVDPRLARWSVVQVFHLLGYRRRRPLGKKLVFTRRPERL